MSISWRHAILDFLSTVIMKREIQDDRKRGAVWDVSHSAGRSDLQKQEWTENNKVDFFCIILHVFQRREAETQSFVGIAILKEQENRAITSEIGELGKTFLGQSNLWKLEMEGESIQY